MIKTGTKAASKGPVWRLASATDIQAITGVAEVVHPTFPERPEVFAEKLSLLPSGCFVLVRHEEVVGYGLSHTWMLNSIPPLDSFLETTPGVADCLYVHDVAVLAEARGHGSAGLYVEMMVDRARQLGVDFLALVSVYRTQPFWARYGFEIANAPDLGTKLRSYGSTAKYMTRNLISP